MIGRDGQRLPWALPRALPWCHAEAGTPVALDVAATRAGRLPGRADRCVVTDRGLAFFTDLYDFPGLQDVAVVCTVADVRECTRSVAFRALLEDLPLALALAFADDVDDALPDALPDDWADDRASNGVLALPVGPAFFWDAGSLAALPGLRAGALLPEVLRAGADFPDVRSRGLVRVVTPGPVRVETAGLAAAPATAGSVPPPWSVSCATVRASACPTSSRREAKAGPRSARRSKSRELSVSVGDAIEPWTCAPTPAGAARRRPPSASACWTPITRAAANASTTKATTGLR